MAHGDRSMLSTAAFGSARLNVWLLCALTAACIALPWLGALDERFHGDAGLIFAIPILCQGVFGLFLLVTTAIGWKRLGPAERIAGLAIGAIGLICSIMLLIPVPVRIVE